MPTEQHNMASWHTRLAQGKTIGKGGGEDITVTLTSRGWNSRAHDKGAYLMVVIGGNPIAELPVEPSLALTFEIDTTGITIKEAEDAPVD